MLQEASCVKVNILSLPENLIILWAVRADLKLSYVDLQ